jgi:hypothetical protein
MTILGGAGTTLRIAFTKLTRARPTGFSHTVGAPRHRAPALRFAPVLRRYLRRYNRRTSSPEEGKGLGFSCEAPAFIMLALLAALYWAILHQRGLRFAPSPRCAGPRAV